MSGLLFWFGYLIQDDVYKVKALIHKNKCTTLEEIALCGGVPEFRMGRVPHSTILFYFLSSNAGVLSNAARQILKPNAGEKVLFYPSISKVLFKTVKEKIYLFTGWTR